MIGHFVTDHFPYFVRPPTFKRRWTNVSPLFSSFVSIHEVFPSLPAHAAWYGSVVVPVPLKVFTYSALRLITGATPPPL